MHFRSLFSIRRFEAFLISETAAKKKTAAFIFFALMIPGPIKYLFIFMLTLRLLPSTIAHRKLTLLLSLPFSRAELFVYSFIYGFSIVFTASSLGWVLFGNGHEPEILRFFIFYAFYFALTLINSVKLGDGMIMPMLLLAADLLSDFIAPNSSALFTQISPIYQNNQPAALGISLLLLLCSGYIFIADKGKRW